MKYRYTIAIALFCLALIGCQKKEAEDEQMIPPGFCKTEAECQPMADRENARQQELRQGRMSQGVHEEYLPCGKYVVTKAPNGFWSVIHDTTGCPATASHEDPHPDLEKAKQLKQNQIKGDTPK